MGLCTSTNKALNNSYRSNIMQLSNLSTNSTKIYKYNLSNNNNLLNKRFNLQFIFCDFKVKFCVSHNQTKNSLYITEIRIGDQLFPLIINKGSAPNISNPEKYFCQQKLYTINELENTELLINIYEFLDDISANIDEKAMLSEEYKQKSNYNSFFHISLISFLFKSMKCDFKMMGNNQLSDNTRISFLCIIDHKEQIIINSYANNNPNMYKLILQSKESNDSSITKQNNCFTLKSTPMTMAQLQRSDLFLETRENEFNYDYISLNSLKAAIIRGIGEKILKQDNILTDSNNILNIINLLDSNNQIKNDEAFLYFENLPVITQISNLYLTEYGHIYNTSFLNLINKDENLQNYRKSKQIFSDDFYNKINRYYEEISKQNFNTDILNDIQVLLLKSIENSKFMFLYPSLDNLNKMVILLLKLGIKIIEKIKNSTSTMIIVVLLRLFNILMKREELDNWVIYECISKFNNTPNSPQKFYNKLYVEMFYLYQLLLSNRFSPNNDFPLIELFSRLYFQKKYFRYAILNTLNRYKYKSSKDPPNQNDVFLYDIMSDEKLDLYIDSDTKDSIRNYIKDKNILENISFNYYRLLKRIIVNQDEIQVNKYPLDFTMFSDNINILEMIERDIMQLRKDNYNKNILNNDFYETLMLLSNSYISISSVNNALIQSTNGHNTYAVYTLFVYFKSLFDYYDSANKNAKLIMDYSVLQIAIQMLTNNESCISIPRLFWFYYCCAHMALSGHLKWFIVNIINKNFDRFAYHWSFTIRQVLFKLVVYIFCVRLKDNEGKLLNKEKIKPFVDHDLKNVGNFLYKTEALKDFSAIEKEFNIWMNSQKEDNNNYEELPQFFLPPPITNNGVLD